ncbi:hypothetical protein NHF48_013160 [Sphingomonas sp. H160509]|uniref:hypothetical protein n=1 Tax=Sphingomonas sp. H160509 TaxID=2955313 RepID=UPI002097047F|nr:hypothetical protein [Sphingomonas sp. H160509]MDD1451710.1 hypothetical protein [Sphingomonas sp. H160509]
MAVADTAQYPTGMAQSGGLLTGRLSAMMFMQFFVWGAWTVTLGLVMQTVGIGNLIGNAFSVGPIASIVGSFLLGMAAARYVSPRMLMVVLHLVGGVLLFVLPSLVTPENGGTFVWLLLCYMIPLHADGRPREHDRVEELWRADRQVPVRPRVRHARLDHGGVDHRLGGAVG